MMVSSSKTVFTNLIWRFAERCGAQLVAFIVSIVLARLLAPEAYGTLALITVFTTILQVFVDSGLGNALIQKKNADNIDFSTVFYTNMVFCIILYLGIFFAAPFIAAFYEDVTLVPFIRVLSLTVIVSGLKNVQQAYVSRNLLFRKFFFATLIGTVCAAIGGIAMAVFGAGVWALVAQQVINVTIDTIVLWMSVKWRPTRHFSITRLKELFAYGWKLLASSLLDTIYSNIRQLLIGKLYTSAELAYYNQGRQFPNLIVTNINSSIDSVLLPVMATEQDNKIRVKQMTQRAIRISSYIMWPLMVGLMFTAEPVVKLVLTEKWLPCVPYLRIFCFTFALYPIHTANLNAIKAVGRSDMFLKLEIIKKVIGMTILLLTLRWGVLVMAYSLLFTAVISSFVNAFPNQKLLDYSYWEQIKDLLPSASLSLCMGIIIYPLQELNCNYVILLVIQVVIGGIIYILGSKILRFSSYSYLMDIVRNFFRGKKK